MFEEINPQTNLTLQENALDFQNQIQIFVWDEDEIRFGMIIHANSPSQLLTSCVVDHYVISKITHLTKKHRRRVPRSCRSDDDFACKIRVEEEVYTSFKWMEVTNAISLVPFSAVLLLRSPFRSISG
ncbi:hypothetical protein L2E82_02521 [Cichorium intybus]|uniref:Uncharacterized protein n=1 Tax=Cichorium intybus TaxID=13427 RepID=A0ACB9H2Q1_CICIN|nr:hypothetical protein L2E82_02521 [Cichorium intybus]